MGLKRVNPKTHGGEPEMITSHRFVPSNIAALRCPDCQVGFFDYRDA